MMAFNPQAMFMQAMQQMAAGFFGQGSMGPNIEIFKNKSASSSQLAFNLGPGSANSSQVTSGKRSASSSQVPSPPPAAEVEEHNESAEVEGCTEVPIKDPALSNAIPQKPPKMSVADATKLIANSVKARDKKKKGGGGPNWGGKKKGGKKKSKKGSKKKGKKKCADAVMLPLVDTVEKAPKRVADTSVKPSKAPSYSVERSRKQCMCRIDGVLC